MKMQIKEFADFAGVSVRTLHYYDEIGLLKPALVDEQTGYRFYDEQSLERMQAILFYRELDFPLKSICEILSFPYYNQEKALKEQKKLLILKKERLERLILAIDDAMKGRNIMNVFDNSDFETTRKEYEMEAKEKWGRTEAYTEFTEKSKNYSKENYNKLYEGMEDIFHEFAQCMQSAVEPDSDKAQALVKKLQEYISVNFYTCTKQILAGLGQMYIADERFQKNIDQHAAGTAEFASKAIQIYCK